MHITKSTCLALCLCFNIVFGVAGEGGSLRRIKRNQVQPNAVNFSKALNMRTLMNANQSNATHKGEPTKEDFATKLHSSKTNSKEEKQLGKHDNELQENNEFDSKYDDVQKPWRSLESHDIYNYEASPFFGISSSVLSPFHSQLVAGGEVLSNQVKARFHHGLPFPLNHFLQRRHDRNRKRSLIKKRKSIIILHSPFQTAMLEPRTLDRRMTKGSDHNSSETSIETMVGAGQNREAVTSLEKPLHFYEYPHFAWNSPKLTFEEHFGTTRVKPLQTGENFFNLADMFLNKFKSGVVPYQTQVTKISATPDMVITATSKSNVPPFFHLGSGVKPNSYGTLNFNPPLQLGGPFGEPKKVLNVIENAIDNMVVDPENKDSADDEIEVHCPVHHKNQEHSNDLGETSADNPKNDVYEVCQCHFIKQKGEK